MLFTKEYKGNLIIDNMQNNHALLSFKLITLPFRKDSATESNLYELSL